MYSESAKTMAPFTTITVFFIAITICHAFVPFQNEHELANAVDIYLDNNERAELDQIYGPIEEWDVSLVSNFGNLFNKERNPKAEFFNADLSRWDMRNARQLHDMFLGAAAFDSDLSSWNVGRVTHFNGLFYGATNFTGHGLENWDVSSGRFFMSMFSSTTSLRNGMNIQNWNVRNAESMVAMFRDSNFGADETNNNLCGWANQLSRNVNTFAMFMRSRCPYTDDPQLGNIETGISFCVSCPPPESNGATNPFPNVLFLMTDQQRFDTIRRTQDELSRFDGTTKIRTPNLDRLSRKGAYFQNAYCQCSVCAPARASLRTGCTIERTGIQHNDLTSEYVNSPLFTDRVQRLEGLDQILTRLGYVSEYYGKWHLPKTLYDGVRYNDYNYASDQFSFRDDSWDRKIRRFLDHFERLGEISKDIPEGMQQDIFTRYPYTPIQVDSRYGYPTGTSLSTQNGFKGYEVTQPNVCGASALSEDYTPSHFNGDIALKALNRLLSEDEPFFLTVSFHNPHPPMVPAWKHLDYYWENRDSLFVSPSINDKLENADYGQESRAIPEYADETAVKEWTAVYYAMIEEIDEYIGQLLDELGDASSNTLIVFTSDHGEMLGAHGKREKNNFFEEASKVPLLIAFEGQIAPDITVEEVVSHLDVVATILDYIGASDQDKSDGKTLRPLIEKKRYNEEYDEDYVVAEWDFRKPLSSNHDVLERRIDERPALMVRKGPHKLMTHKLASSNKIDMMYNLQNDPYEVQNLLGSNAATATLATLGKAEHLRCLLIEWMERLDGDIGYYSDRSANYGEGEGDIKELQNRQSWPPQDFWVGDQSVEIGRLALDGNRLIRSEYLYMGTRTPGTVTVTSIRLTGPHSRFFSIDQNELFLRERQCHCVKITFSGPVSLLMFKVEIEASIVLSREGSLDQIIPLYVSEQDGDLIYNALGPTNSPSFITDQPSKVPSANPSKIPSGTPSTISDQPSKAPSANPSTFPSGTPSTISDQPSKAPSANPSTTPSGTPSTGNPSTAPSKIPTHIPFGVDEFFRISHSRSEDTTDVPSHEPTVSATPSVQPSFSPSTSIIPSIQPSTRPSLRRPSSQYPEDLASSAFPSLVPTGSTSPSISNMKSTYPSTSPSYSKTHISYSESKLDVGTNASSFVPTGSESPTNDPTTSSSSATTEWVGILFLVIPFWINCIIDCLPWQ